MYTSHQAKLLFHKYFSSVEPGRRRTHIHTMGRHTTHSSTMALSPQMAAAVEDKLTDTLQVISLS